MNKYLYKLLFITLIIGLSGCEKIEIKSLMTRMPMRIIM